MECWGEPGGGHALILSAQGPGALESVLGNDHDLFKVDTRPSSQRAMRRPTSLGARSAGRGPKSLCRTKSLTAQGLLAGKVRPSIPGQPRELHRGGTMLPPMAGWVRSPKPHKVPVDQGPWVSWGPLLPEARRNPGTTVQHHRRAPSHTGPGVSCGRSRRAEAGHGVLTRGHV